MLQRQLKQLSEYEKFNCLVKSYLCKRVETLDIPLELEPISFFDLFTGEPVSEPALGYLWETHTHLNVLCVMIDSSPHSNAELRFDKTWEKGDLFEFFFMPNSLKGHYYELHLAPNQATLELAIPNAEKLIAGEYPFESLFFESGMEAEAFVFGNGTLHGWWAHLKIPHALYRDDLDPKHPAKFMMGRYNYKPGIKDPEISATAHLPFPRFHQPEYWAELKFDS